jgi:hypothetical protein
MTPPRLRTAGAFLLGLLALCCASAGPVPADRPERLAAGRAEYKGPVAPYMDPRPSDLRGIAARRGGVFPHAAIEAFIDGRDPIAAHGSRAMPIWGAAFREETELDQLTETRVRGRIVLLVQYLESIQQP